MVSNMEFKHDESCPLRAFETASRYSLQGVNAASVSILCVLLRWMDGKMDGKKERWMNGG